MNYVCENYEINKEKAEDRSAALAAYAGKIVLGTKEKEKKEEAAKNGMSNFTPVTIKSMTETLIEMCGEEQFELMEVPTEADEMMYIMSNTENVNGAAAIIDPDNMDLARSYMQDDFYILPSSVHEVLLVKQNQMSVEELEDMVKTVNASAVALQDRLSDHVYKYDFARHEIYRADQEQQRQAELNAEQARTHATGR